VTHTVLGGLVGAAVAAALGFALVLTGSLAPAATVVNATAVAGLVLLTACIGFASHLLGDVLTPMGLRPLQPWSDTKYTLDLVYASNSIANKALWVVGAGAFVAAVVVGISLRNGTV